MPTADELLGPDEAAGLVSVLAAAAPARSFENLRAAVADIGPLGLRERCDLLTGALLADVPGSFDDVDELARAALADPRFTSWMIWPVSEAVSARALADGSAEAFDRALACLAELTVPFTAEFAIRPLLAADLRRAIPIVLTWTRHPDERVRRLASEGTRPFLPWATRVPAILAEPAAAVPILDELHRDGSEFVRRSVANHLNDLNRQQPALAVATAARWLEDPGPGTAWVVRHGLRTLVKRGDPAALALLGFHPAEVEVTGPTLAAPSVAVGDALAFELTVRNVGAEPARLAIDYVVHHRKANGTRTPKVFKLATRTLAPGESATFARQHSFKPITTRRYHPGGHAIEAQVNGITSGRVDFDLLGDE